MSHYACRKIKLSNEELSNILQEICKSLSSSFLYALIGLLSEKGILIIEEPDERKKRTERLMKKFTESGMGLMYQDSEYDQYYFEHKAHVDYQIKLPFAKPYAADFL